SHLGFQEPEIPERRRRAAVEGRDARPSDRRAAVLLCESDETDHRTAEEVLSGPNKPPPRPSPGVPGAGKARRCARRCISSWTMNTTTPIYQVDAFTGKAFTGNPAAVCLLKEDQHPGAPWMQLVAAEMNLAETAFVQPEPTGDAFSLRWFT